jgi:hypothetical protein
MKEKNVYGKWAVITIILLFLCINIVPATIGSQELKKSQTTVSTNEECNLFVWVKPTRHTFPRVYESLHNIIGFEIAVMNEGPGNSTAGTLTFEIIKAIGKEPGVIYNETFTYGSLHDGQGRGYLIPWWSWMKGRFGVFAARVTIDVDDTVLTDNTKSFYFIMLHVFHS